MAIRFNENDARPLGRTARGVKAIALDADDEVVGMAVVDYEKMLLTVTESGYGRRSEFSEYRRQSRGGKGLTNYKVEKYGKVASIQAVTDDEDAIMITSEGIIIRIAVDSISTFARTAKGVCVMKFKNENEHVISMQITEHDEEEAQQAEAPSEADAADNAPEAEESEAPASVPEGVEEAFNAVMENAERNSEE